MDPNFIDLSPSPKSHIRTLTRIGYTFNSAVSDIIDNSIAANCSNIWIDTSHTDGDVKISIADDGCGMSRDELIQNMRIGCKDPDQRRSDNDLGRFGSGLKTASFSQAEVLIVCSKKKNTDFTGAEWDIEQVRESNSWKLRLLDDEEVANNLASDYLKNDSGTVVLWQRLHKFINLADGYPIEIEDMLASEISNLRCYIGLHFHKFLSGRSKINIYINGQKISAISPFMEEEDGYWEGPSQFFRMRNREGKIEIKVHNIPHKTKLSRDASEKLEILNKFTNGQGFYVYRNKRLIIAGGWLGLARKSQLGKLARVEVNIPSSLDDDWTTDVKKSSIEIPYQVKARLKAAMQTPVNQSKRAYNYRGIAEKANDYWNIVENKLTNQTSYQISPNNDDLLELIAGLTYAQKGMLMSYLRNLALNIPYHNIYYVQADGKKSINQDAEELDRVLQEILFSE